jgi:hypothetical protein
VGRVVTTPTPPGLEFVYETTADLAPPIPVGPTPDGDRRIVPIRGEGRIHGPRIAGRLLAESADWQRTRSDGVVVVDAIYAILTDDGTVIQVRNRGLRHGPDDVMRRLAAGEPVDPGAYYFRTVPEFIAPAGPYDWMNRSIFVCTGQRDPDRVRIQVWRVV